MRDSEPKPAIVARSRGLIVREVDGEIVVLDSSADLVHQFNATASVIWQLATDGVSRSDIATYLAQRFDVSSEQALSDVDRVLETFAALDLIGFED